MVMVSEQTPDVNHQFLDPVKWDVGREEWAVQVVWHAGGEWNVDREAWGV